jgi:hypothetical protein
VDIRCLHGYFEALWTLAGSVFFGYSLFEITYSIFRNDHRDCKVRIGVDVRLRLDHPKHSQKRPALFLNAPFYIVGQATMCD